MILHEQFKKQTFTPWTKGGRGGVEDRPGSTACQRNQSTSSFALKTCAKHEVESLNGGATPAVKPPERSAEQKKTLGKKNWKSNWGRTPSWICIFSAAKSNHLHFTFKKFTPYAEPNGTASGAAPPFDVNTLDQSASKPSDGAQTPNRQCLTKHLSE